MTERPKLDAIDRRIVRALQENGRISISDLSGSIGLSSSACHRRLRILEENGVIDRYVAIMNPSAFGLKVTAFITVKLTTQTDETLEQFKRTVSAWPEVLECHWITGHLDFLIRVVAEDLEAYEEFLRTKLTRLDNIATLESTFSLDTVKSTHALPIP